MKPSVVTWRLDFNGLDADPVESAYEEAAAFARAHEIGWPGDPAADPWGRPRLP